MYKLKSIARRGSLLGAAAALLLAMFIPASQTFADALNPLTKRTLTLSSSSPGWSDTDGSGNSTYAQPNSGANGKQTGNVFSFNTSSNATIKAFTFQYCTLAAGICTAPGNDGWSGSPGSETLNPDDLANGKNNLRIVSASPTELSGAAYSRIFPSDTTGDATGTVGDTTVNNNTAIPAANGSEGDFVVETQDPGTHDWSQSSGWSMAVTNNEDGTVANGTKTTENNFITLTNAAGVALASDQSLKIVFFATTANYITNPGAGAFFVKINDYTSDTTLDSTTLTDGGVTVANVVNQSIEIQTKVLETMDFSVGTVDPDTLSDAQLSAANGESGHGQCDSILPAMTPITAGSTGNVLALGDQTSESSLSTAHTYSTHSYWRLSSNSSAGATVYYSGETLSNTEGDQIAAIGRTAVGPHIGSPQFGLALDNGISSSGYAVDYTTEETPLGGLGGVQYGVYENGADTAATQGVDASTVTDTSADVDYHAPALTPMAPAPDASGGATNYGLGTGNVNSSYGPITSPDGTSAHGTAYAFDPNSNVSPVPIASDAGQVVDCVTAKVRYIANIAATTPAGIYTTKINYIAAPEY
jgi:hypothetical protein